MEDSFRVVSCRGGIESIPVLYRKPQSAARAGCKVRLRAELRDLTDARPPWARISRRSSRADAAARQERRAGWIAYV